MKVRNLKFAKDQLSIYIYLLYVYFLYIYISTYLVLFSLKGSAIELDLPSVGSFTNAHTVQDGAWNQKPKTQFGFLVWESRTQALGSSLLPPGHKGEAELSLLLLGHTSAGSWVRSNAGIWTKLGFRIQHLSIEAQHLLIFFIYLQENGVLDKLKWYNCPPDSIWSYCNEFVVPDFEIPQKIMESEVSANA